MSTPCVLYVVPPGFQLGAGPTGPVDCTAWAASRVIGASTCGATVPSGRAIRLASSEPVPDPESPGLNIGQVAAVAWDVYGVYLEVRTGSRRMPWAEYEARRRMGEPMLLQVDYGPIADTMFNAGRGFRGGHAIAETQHATYDPLADGRANGVWRHDGRIYTRTVIRKAAGQLVIGRDPNGRAIRVGDGYVWAAVGRDTAPEFAAAVRPRPGRTWRTFTVYDLSGGVIKGVSEQRTRGFSAACTPPRAIRWPGHVGLRYLVQLTDGSRAGLWINRKWSHER